MSSTHSQPAGRRFQDSKIRRVFTVFQLTTILDEARHSLIIIEHDHLLYKDAKGWLITSPKVYAMLHAVLLLFSPGTDPFLEDLTRNPIEYSISMGSRVTQKAEELGHPGGVLMILQEFDTFFCTIYI